MLVVYPIIYDTFFYMPGGDGRIYEPSTVSMSIFVGYDFATVWVCFLDVLWML